MYSNASPASRAAVKIAVLIGAQHLQPCVQVGRMAFDRRVHQADMTEHEGAAELGHESSKA